MELTKLYPAWFNHQSSTGWLQFTDYKLMLSLKLSLLHQQNLTDLFGVDRYHQVETCYICQSYEFELTFKLRTWLSVCSVCYLWPVSNWFERELWEMFGCSISNHPDLRRLLTDYGFRGYPLLKSYPLIGYYQVSYSEKLKRLTNQPVNVSQEFREFDFLSPWQK